MFLIENLLQNPMTRIPVRSVWIAVCRLLAISLVWSSVLWSIYLFFDARFGPEGMEFSVPYAILAASWFIIALVLWVCADTIARIWMDRSWLEQSPPAENERKSKNIASSFLTLALGVLSLFVCVNGVQYAMQFSVQLILVDLFEVRNVAGLMSSLVQVSMGGLLFMYSGTLAEILNSPSN